MTHNIPYEVREEPPDVDGVVIWSNPDIPLAEKVLSGEVEEFWCPYPTCPEQEPSNVAMPEDNDIEENREQFVALLEQNDGTFRCDDCGEPFYAFYGDGDGDHDR